ncbi:ciliary microtubule inner protein 2B-like [Dendropsophus ebraccatus]|uniref:ciliary microtubule inner protein 2B-like n=1 Tax=Dendropsophus ebraccatus TaxID=150705 RepID=UPI003832276E
MPIILPQIPESLFSTYDPKYVPCYTGFTPKLRSEQGKIYGNATLRSSNYEPGLQRYGDNHMPSFNIELGENISNFPRGDAENWNNKQGYFHPSNGKYFYTQTNHTYDRSPQTSSAIKAIEEIKYQLSMPTKCTSSEKDRDSTLRSKCNGRAEQTVDMSSLSSHKNENIKKIFKEDVTEQKPCTRLSHTDDYLQRRQGKVIYRTKSGLLPNYSGYTPGQMFSIGSTWGRSSANAIGKMQQQTFQLTSLF